ncbi:MAG: hypothetical protein AAGC44_14930 [Planctomycetota bacterium]
MHYTIVLDHLQESPFVPFEVVTNAGTRHKVPHPEFATATTGALYVFKPGKDGLMDPVKVSYDNISELAPLPEEAA